MKSSLVTIVQIRGKKHLSVYICAKTLILVFSLLLLVSTNIIQQYIYFTFSFSTPPLCLISHKKKVVIKQTKVTVDKKIYRCMHSIKINFCFRIKIDITQYEEKSCFFLSSDSHVNVNKLTMLWRSTTLYFVTIHLFQIYIYVNM